MAHPIVTKVVSHRALTLLFVVFAIALLTGNLLAAGGSELRDRYLKLDNAKSSVTARYEFGFTPPSLGLIQIIELQVCSNDPYPGTPCTAPVGFDASNAVLAAQSGDTGFTISPDSTANKIVLSRAPFSSNGQPDRYAFTNVVNPSSNGSYFVRVRTFQDADTNGTANYYGGIGFSINNNVSVQATVPPYLLFCVGVTVNGLDCNDVVGSYVDFGEFSNRQVSLGSTQMLAASNAIDGYAIRVTGTTLTSGTNTIPELTGADISRPGVSQFGLNLRANSSPQGGQDVLGGGTGQPTNGYNQINFYRFNTGDVVAASTEPDTARKYTAEYIVNVAKGQAPGVYVSTLTYIALGSY